MAFHPLGPLAIGNDAFFALRVEQRVGEDRAGRFFARRKIAQDLANATGRADMHGAMALAGKQARHFVNRDGGQFGGGLLRGAHGIGQQGAAALAVLGFARVGRCAAGGANDH
jgi:hypothetical protein